MSRRIRVLDGKDTMRKQELLRFVQNVFDVLDAESREKGEPRLKARLIDTSVEGFTILGHCRQHPTETIYDATEVAYRGLKSLRQYTTDAPAVQPPSSDEVLSRFRR